MRLSRNYRFADNLCFDFAKHGRPKVPMRKLSPSQSIKTEVHAPGFYAFAQQTPFNARCRAAASISRIRTFSTVSQAPAMQALFLRAAGSGPMFFSRFFLFSAHFPQKCASSLRDLMVLHDFIKKFYCKSRKHFGQLETHLFKNYNAEYRDLHRNSRRFRGVSIENFRVKRYYRRNALCYAANIF